MTYLPVGSQALRSAVPNALQFEVVRRRYSETADCRPVSRNALRRMCHTFDMVVVAAGLTWLLAGWRTALAQESRPSRTAAIAGVVLDSAGRPVNLATVLVERLEASAITDDSGRFHVGNLPAGPVDVRVVRLGFEERAFSLVLPADSTVVLTMRLRAIVLIAPVNISATVQNQALQRAGFYDRERVGLGTFLGPARIDSLAAVVSSPAQMLREVRGLEVRCSGVGCTVFPRRAPRCIWLFIDGAYSDDQIDDLLTIGGIYAIEVYERPSTVPTEFQARLPQKRGSGLTTGAGCAALVVWTKARGRR